MAYEYPGAAGVLRLAKVRGRWLVHYMGRRAGGWASADVAAKSVAQHRSGLSEWDCRREPVPDDLLRWRPLGDSL